MSVTIKRYKPTALPVREKGIPDALKIGKRFVVWRYVWDGKKWRKRPLQPNGRAASTTNPTTWSTFAEVMKAYRKGGCDGIGIVLGDGLVGADFDRCRDAVSGAIEVWAQEHCDTLDTYTEISPGAPNYEFRSEFVETNSPRITRHLSRYCWTSWLTSSIERFIGPPNCGAGQGCRAQVLF